MFNYPHKGFHAVRYMIDIHNENHIFYCICIDVPHLEGAAHLMKNDACYFFAMLK